MIKSDDLSAYDDRIRLAAESCTVNVIRFEENLKIKDYKYLDKKRAREIIFNK